MSEYRADVRQLTRGTCSFHCGHGHTLWRVFLFRHSGNDLVELIQYSDTDEWRWAMRMAVKQVREANRDV